MQSTADSQTLRPYRTGLAFGFFNATTWMISLGTPMVLLAGQLGASSFEVGLMYSFFFLLLPIQVLSTTALPRFGYRRLMVFGWATRPLFLIIPLTLAWLAPADPARWMVIALIWSSFFFALFRSIGSCAFMPWMYALIPERVRGRYFATDQSLAALAGLLTLLLCALLFWWLPVWDAFFWQYVFAISGSVLTVWFLSRIQDVAKPAETSVRAIVRETPRLCLQRGIFRQYLLFMIVAGLAGTSFAPFAYYYLKTVGGYPDQGIMLLSAAQYGGAMIGGTFMRGRIDRHGAHPVFRLSLAITACVLVFWVLFVAGYTASGVGLALSVFGYGFATTNWAVANLKHLPQACPEGDRALPISVHGSVVGVLGGLSPLLWGLFVKQQDGAPGVDAENFILYFLVSLTVHLGLLLYVRHLPLPTRDLPGLQTSNVMARPLRYIGQLINAVPGVSRR
jgi:MFS family permease